jgi:predicted transcriptional regulator
MADSNFDAMYEKYKKEAEDIMAKEKTAVMIMSNEGSSLDPKKFAQMDKVEALAFWEKSKCLTP